MSYDNWYGFRSHGRFGRRHYHGGFGGGRRSRGAGGGGGRYFGRGGVRMALLELLSREPMHGYQMIRTLEAESGGFYSPSPGSIYPTLQMLEDQGLVTASVEDGKKVYALTEAGRIAAQERPEHAAGFRGRDLDGSGTGCRQESREMRLRRKLGLSEEGFAVLQRLTLAENAAVRSPDKEEKLRELLREVSRLLDGYIAESGGTGDDAANGGTAP